MFFGSEIKTENNICNLCLSINRFLKPLGKYCTLFKNIMQEKSTLLLSMNLNNTYICWECAAVMDKVIIFQKKVLEAQFRLNAVESHDMKHKPLSTLTTVSSSEANYYFEEETTIHDLKSILENIKPDNEDVYDKDDFDEFDTKDFDVNELNDVEIDNNQQYFIGIEEDTEIKLEKAVKENKYNEKVKNEQELRYIKSEGILFNNDNCPEVIFNQDKLSEYRNKLMNQIKYLKGKYKCSKCILVYRDKRNLQKHNNIYHNKNSKGTHKCEICTRKFSEKNTMVLHMRCHYRVYHCKVCNLLFQTKSEAKEHFRVHKQLYTCRQCNIPFTTLQRFQHHYREQHSYLVCDYCKKKFKRKPELINHIMKKHLPKKTFCDICKKNIKRLRDHNRIFHTVSETPSYCVECDLTFINPSLYRRHLLTSAKHGNKSRAGSYPCPACNKVYARLITMNYHYKHVHDQQSKFKCHHCEKSFLNGYRLRQHIASIHNKIRAVKDKMCNICGRAFSTNRILINHVRTHTGERPNQCPHCPASFNQKTAMVVHIKNIHAKKTLL